MNNSRACVARAAVLSKAASARYNKRFDAKVFKAATDGKTVAYRHRLINSALALCGDCSYRVAWHWCDAAWTFLALFA